MATASATLSSGRAASYDVSDAGRRRRDLVELAVGYGLILVVIWTPRPWQRVFYIAAILWIAAATYVSFDGWKVMGLRLGGMLRSLWVVGRGVGGGVGCGDGGVAAGDGASATGRGVVRQDFLGVCDLVVDAAISAAGFCAVEAAAAVAE